MIGLLGMSMKKYYDQRKREGFDDVGAAVAGMSAAWFSVVMLINILNLAITVAALVMSFRRANGFHFGSFLAAICCSLCYLVYALVVPVQQAPSSGAA